MAENRKTSKQRPGLVDNLGFVEMPRRLSQTQYAKEPDKVSSMTGATLPVLDTSSKV